MTKSENNLLVSIAKTYSAYIEWSNGCISQFYVSFLETTEKESDLSLIFLAWKIIITKILCFKLKKKFFLYCSEQFTFLSKEKVFTKKLISTAIKISKYLKYELLPLRLKNDCHSCTSIHKVTWFSCIPTTYWNIMKEFVIIYWSIPACSLCSTWISYHKNIQVYSNLKNKY